MTPGIDPVFQDPEQLRQQRAATISGYAEGPVLWTDPETRATIDVNSVPEQVIDALIARHGNLPQLKARKEFLQAQREQGADQQTQNFDAVQSEVNKRTNANLRQQLEDIFGGVQQSGENSINANFADQRRKLIDEEGALGRLRSPASIASLSGLDNQKNLALSDMIGKVQAAKGAGALDVSKAIESILAADRQGIRTSNDAAAGRQLELSKLATATQEGAADRNAKYSYLDSLLRQQRDAGSPDELDKIQKIAATASAARKGYTDVVGGGTEAAGDAAKIAKMLGGAF